ncbi:MAG: hypothetical protein JRD68_06520 [Deltaproteobacteria bacterium]|nr:hypothetical protein [Deltaproteobacteria bacterium]
MPNLKSKRKARNRRMKHRLQWPETANPGSNNAITSMDRLGPRAQYLASFLLG